MESTISLSGFLRYQNICSKSLSNSYDCYTPLWSTRRCGRLQYGCADWRKNCSTNHSSCCAKRSHSPSHHSSGKNRCVDAGWRNTVPSFHNCNYGRWNRWFRSWSARKRSYNYGIHYWCRWRTAGSAISLHLLRPQIRRVQNELGLQGADLLAVAECCNGHGAIHISKLRCFEKRER